MREYAAAVIGAGAAGIVAATSAARRGRSVVLCDRMACVGRKISISGNGRCNLANNDLDESHFNASASPLVKDVFGKFGKNRISEFFDGLGLKTYSDRDRVFPATNQAASVVRVLEIELKRLKIPIELGFEAAAVSHSSGGFLVRSADKREIRCRSLVLACGGRSYPALGSDGSGYALAQAFGHAIVKPVPAAVPLVVKDRLMHFVQGQKISAVLRSVIAEKTGEPVSGDLLFTKYGLSGTAVLDVSTEISVAVNRLGVKDAAVLVDLVPFMSGPGLALEIGKRLAADTPPEDLLTGILPNRFGPALKGIISGCDKDAAASRLKEMRFAVSGTRGWNEAEFTAGGVSTKEVTAELESKRQSGLYFAGEMLDVDGERGGYNLAWAWASGFVAGEAA